jgi:hypothetical protein
MKTTYFTAFLKKVRAWFKNLFKNKDKDTRNQLQKDIDELVLKLDENSAILKDSAIELNRLAKMIRAARPD